MDFIFEERPSDSPLVERIWQTRSHGGGSFISTAENHWEMVVTRQRDTIRFTIRGPETAAKPAPVPVDAEFFGIIFEHGAYMPHLPVSDLVDREIDLPGASSRSVWLNGSTWEVPSFENADTFIARLLREEMLVCDPVIETVLGNRTPELSIRSVQRRFLRATGLTRGQFDQIERARQAASLLESGATIADAVYFTGYSDQPHLTRSLKRFTGQTPGQILAAVGTE